MLVELAVLVVSAIIVEFATVVGAIMVVELTIFGPTVSVELVELVEVELATSMTDELPSCVPLPLY